MVGTGRFYFDRDVDCIVAFFEKRFKYVSDKPRPTWEGVLATRQGTLDVIAAASGFIGDKEIAEFEKAGGLGERFGDEEGDLDVAAQEEEEDEEDDDESEPTVVNQGTGQGGEKIIERDEDIQFKSLRQAEALALRRLREDAIGNMYSSQLEPEPEPGPDDAGVDAETDTGGVPRLGEESKALEIKRAERDKSGHRRVAAEARLARLAQLSGEQTTDDGVEEDSEGDEEDEEDDDAAGLERVDVSRNVAAGKVHFIQPKEIQKQGGEPEEEDGGAAGDGNRPRYARGGGRRAPPKKLTAEEQAALIRQRVAKSKSGRPRNGGGRRGQEGGHGKKSKAKNASNKNVKAMMQSI